MSTIIPQIVTHSVKPHLLNKNSKVAISLNDSPKNRPPWPHVVARVLPPLHAPCAADGSHRSVAGPGGPGGRGAEEPTGPPAWGSGETIFYGKILQTNINKKIWINMDKKNFVTFVCINMALQDELVF